MNWHGNTLAKRYAQACIQVGENDLTQNSCKSIQLLIDCLNDNRHLNSLFSLVLIPLDEKKKGLKELQKKFTVPSVVIDILLLLIKHQRAHLMSATLHYIIELLYKKYRILACELNSSHQLNQEQIDILINFFAHKTKHTIIYAYAVDPTLIAGVRIVSPTIMWEHSIDQRLRKIARVLQTQDNL